MSDETRGLPQNTREFAVQITTADYQHVMGTGFFVSADGLIGTCAHVVQNALGVERKAAVGDEVGVVYERARPGQPDRWRARVCRVFDDSDDDVALLQLLGDPPVLDSEQVAVLGPAVHCKHHDFESFGYRRLDTYVGLPASGTITGFANKPNHLSLRDEPIVLDSKHINRGMSGAAVLDLADNLVIGVVSEKWKTWLDLSKRAVDLSDRDTGFAVKADLFSLSPFNLPLRGSPLPPRPPRQPQADLVAAAGFNRPFGFHWQDAPDVPPEWVDRPALLEALNVDWSDSRVCIVALVGFGGEGKSTLARKWVGGLRTDGVFWWSVNARPNVEAFLESALKFVGGDPQQFPGAAQRVNAIVGALMSTPKRIVFVLDGLEVMQAVEGGNIGSIPSHDLRDFLELFAGGRHRSLCLFTTRVPLADLARYPTYREHDVSALEPEEARLLVQKLGVPNRDAAQDIASRWGGHALALTLASRRAAGQGEDAIASPAEPREALSQLLRDYDTLLSDSQRNFLITLSALHLPLKRNQLPALFPDLSALVLGELTESLINLRLLRRNPTSDAFSLHPHVQAHYAEALVRAGRSRNTHRQLINFYRNQFEPPDGPLTLTDLAPLIEAVHHACEARDFATAEQILWGQIYRGERYVLTTELGAYETELALMRGFYPKNDLSRQLIATRPDWRRRIVRRTAFALMMLGRLTEALPLYERLIEMNLAAQDNLGTSLAYQDVSRLLIALGDLEAGNNTVDNSLMFARQTENANAEKTALALRGWIAHLRGDREAAIRTFAEAIEALHRYKPELKQLDGLSGALYSNYLLRVGQLGMAREVIIANIENAEGGEQRYRFSRFYRLLGEFEAASRNFETALGHYTEALRYAYNTSNREVLIEALISRGRFAAQIKENAEAARADLSHALHYAKQSGYLLLEADARVVMAQAHRAGGDRAAAQAEADFARRLSARIGYYWGERDAEAVLAV